MHGNSNIKFLLLLHFKKFNTIAVSYIQKKTWVGQSVKLLGHRLEVE